MLSTARPNHPAMMLAEALQSSAMMIDKYLQQDRCFPELSEQLSVPSHYKPSISGFSDMEYPFQGPGVPSLPELSAVDRVPHPPEVAGMFNDIQLRMMGVFPEISRAWLTIDNKIYMWNYKDGSDVTYFEGLIENIKAVGLVKPKQGVLQSHIHYLLVLATRLEVVILGLNLLKYQAGLDDSMTGGIKLIPRPVFYITTDICMVSITSTDLGRIFMAGKDGCLYEIVYQAEAGWFTPRCRKINHSKSSPSFLIPSLFEFFFSEDDPIVQIAVDNSRNTLFTRSEKGVLRVYDLGKDGQGMSRVAEMSQNSIIAAVGEMTNTIDHSVFKPIIHISVIDRSESSNCQLLAVTHAGVRLYFSTVPFLTAGQKHVTLRPSLLTLVHVRLPPGLSASSTLQKPAQVHKALHSKGILLMAASETEDNDILWCINHDSFPFKKPLMETQMTYKVEGHSWALCAIEEEKPAKVLTPLNRKKIPSTDPPIIVQQHNTPPQKFVLLSTKGSHIFYKLRPIDQLRDLLLGSHRGESVQIQRFFKLHGEEQACATLLFLACSTAACDRVVSQWATRAFFRYGREVGMHFTAAVQFPAPVRPAQDIIPPALATPGVPMMLGVASITHMTSGTCIYFARILGNIWDGALVVEKTITEGKQTISILESSVTSYELQSVLHALGGLQQFLNKNADFSPSSFDAGSFTSPASLEQRQLGFMHPGGANSQQVQQDLHRNDHTQPQVYEKVFLESIRKLIDSSYQTLYLWQLLSDNQISHIMYQLPQEFQKQMKGLSFRDLVINDKEIVGGLITALINLYIKDNDSVDSISNHLRDRCPLLYSSDDRICSKGNELLQRSKQMQNKVEKERTLRESLRLYQQISHLIDLPLVCSQYRQVHFYEAVLKLCLTAADKKDPERLGLHFYRNGAPEEDRVGKQAFQERLLCYKCIIDIMQELENQSKFDPNKLSNKEAAAHFNQMMRLAQRSRDELFHITLYISD